MSAEFKAAAEKVKQLQKEPSQEELLQLYAHFKQGSQDPPIEDAPKPGMFNLKDKAKRAEWQKLVDAGVTPEQAQTKYIALVEEMVGKYGLKE